MALHQQARTIEDQNRQLAERLEERDRAQAALGRHAAELQRSNAELDRFASMVGHDLLEPLHVVNGLLELLGDRHGAALDADGCLLVERARARASALVARIDDLLAEARGSVDPMRLERVDLDSVIGRALDDLRPLLEEAAATVRSDPLPEVVGDEWLLGRVFSQLLDHAVRLQAARVGRRPRGRRGPEPAGRRLGDLRPRQRPRARRGRGRPPLRQLRRRRRRGGRRAGRLPPHRRAPRGHHLGRVGARAGDQGVLHRSRRARVDAPARRRRRPRLPAAGGGGPLRPGRHGGRRRGGHGRGGGRGRRPAAARPGAGRPAALRGRQRGGGRPRAGGGPGGGGGGHVGLRRPGGGAGGRGDGPGPRAPVQGRAPQPPGRRAPPAGGHGGRRPPHPRRRLRPPVARRRPAPARPGASSTRPCAGGSATTSSTRSSCW